MTSINVRSCSATWGYRIGMVRVPLAVLGVVIEVLYHGEWILTRFDMMDAWVLEDIPTKEIAGLIVRI